MSLSLLEISPHLLYQFKSEHELISLIQTLSVNFTEKREKISDYLTDSRLISAYTAFYLLTNFPKLQAVLNFMPPSWIEELKSCDFIDLGAGPGTFSLAWRELGGVGEFYQVEPSKLMREQARKIWEGLYTEKLFQGESWHWNPVRKKFLLFGHSANEMGYKKVMDYIREIDPDHLLFIEPGTREFFPEMLLIRSSLIEMGYELLYPCPSRERCPMEGSGEWCHQFVYVQQHHEIERISQKVKKDRKLLPLTLGAYSKTLIPQIAESKVHERIVRVFPETKFSHEWLLCHDNQLEHYQLMKRNLPKKDSKFLSTLLSGEALDEILGEVENSKPEVKLKRMKIK